MEFRSIQSCMQRGNLHNFSSVSLLLDRSKAYFSFYLFNTWYSLKAFVFNEETRSLRSSRIESAHDKSLTSPSLQLDLSTSSLITAALVTRKLHTTSGGRAQVRAPRGNERPLRREEDKSAAEKRIRDLARLLL